MATIALTIETLTVKILATVGIGNLQIIKAFIEAL